MLAVQHNVDELSADIQAEIHKAEDRLTAQSDSGLMAIIAGFTLDGREHKAYYVARPDHNGFTRFAFECLIY